MEIPTLLDACKACLHQLSTDAELETVGAPHKYVELVEMLGRAIAEVEPDFPPVRRWTYGLTAFEEAREQYMEARTLYVTAQTAVDRRRAADLVDAAEARLKSIP